MRRRFTFKEYSGISDYFRQIEGKPNRKLRIKLLRYPIVWMIVRYFTWVTSIVVEKVKEIKERKTPN